MGSLGKILSKMERLLLLLSSLLATAQGRPQFFSTDLSATVVQSFNSETDFKNFKDANAVFHTPEDDDIFRQLDQEFDSFYGPQQYDENAEYELIEYPIYDSRAEIGTPVSGSGSGFFFGSSGTADTSSSKDRFNEIFDQQANNRGNNNNRGNSNNNNNRGQTDSNKNKGQSAETSSSRGPPITASGVQPFRGASVTSEQPKGARFPVASSQNNGGRPSIRTPVNPTTTRRTTRRPTTRRTTTTTTTTTTRRPTTSRATTTRTTSTEEPRIPKIFPNSGKLDPFTEAPLGNKIGGTPGPRRKGPSFKIKLKFPKRRRGNNRNSTTTAAPAEDRSGSSRSEGGRSTGREGFSYSDLLEAGQAGQPVTRTEADAPNEFDVYHAVPNY